MNPTCARTLVLVSLSTLSLVACGGDDSATPGGADGGPDVTASDAANDATSTPDAAVPDRAVAGPDVTASDDGNDATSTPDAAVPDRTVAGPDVTSSDAGGDAANDATSTPDRAVPDGAVVDVGSDAPRCFVDAAGATTIIDAVQVSVGTQGVCILRQGNVLLCRGTNSTPHAFPADAGTVNITRLETGSSFACVLDDARRMWCWGANGSGQLAADVDGGTLYPVLIQKGGVPIDVDDMAVAFQAACVIEHGTRDVYCWGNSELGELGAVDASLPDGGTQAAINAPTRAGFTASATARLTTPRLAVGFCLLDGPSLTCWGGNQDNQLGMPASTSPTTTTAIPAALTDAGGVLPITDLSMSPTHTCVIDATKHLYCWGAVGVACGSLATGNGTPAIVPELDAGVAAVSNGAFHTCAIDGRGHARCFGDTNNGVLGNGDTSGTAVPVPQTVLGPDGGGALENVVRISNGFVQTCAIVQGACGADGPGALYCWGNNSQGVLGNPEAGNQSGVPVPSLIQ